MYVCVFVCIYFYSYIIAYITINRATNIKYSNFNKYIQNIYYIYRLLLIIIYLGMFIEKYTYIMYLYVTYT